MPNTKNKLWTLFTFFKPKHVVGRLSNLYKHNLTMSGEKLKVLELYSGIGGMHYAWKYSQIEGEVVAAIEINTVANRVYRHNFPDTDLLNRNIESLTSEYLNTLLPDVILMSPPCQPFTRNGLQKDSEDPRTDSFEHLLGVLDELTSVKYILLENVKGFEDSNTRRSFIETLERCNFHYKEFLLSPHQFGVSNSRMRYYCLARRKPFTSLGSSIDLIYDLPGVNDQECFKIETVLDYSVDIKGYKLPAKFLKRAFVLDICYNDSRRSCCFTKAYTHFLEGTGSVFTDSKPEDVKNVFEECKNMDVSAEEHYSKLETLSLRFFTPKEVSRLMSFPESFTFPKDITDKQRYRLLGNSINVKVVGELILFLINSV